MLQQVERKEDMTQEIWDPLRKKNVALTPEERVRQWFISAVLKGVMGVPEHMMRSEVEFRLGEKSLRADILVYGRDAAPLAVVECKRPDVELTADVLMQVVRYNMVLNVSYIFVTNGKKTVGFALMEGEDRTVRLDTYPSYGEMFEKRSHAGKPQDSPTSEDR